MRILSAALEVASAGSNPEATPPQMAIDRLLPVVRTALQQANIDAAEIDMFVTLSISPDHVAIDPAIIGPRIGHPLQRALGADKAYVFDLMDASVAKALHIADIFASQQGYSRVLLTRSECTKGLREDVDSGFALADGAMACVIEPDGASRFASAPVSGVKPLVIELNDDIRCLTDPKAFIRFSPTVEIKERYRRATVRAAEALKGASTPLVTEDWLTVATAGEQSRMATSGPFDLGIAFSELLAEGRCGTLTAISFDAFGPAADAVTVGYGRA